MYKNASKNLQKRTGKRTYAVRAGKRRRQHLGSKARTQGNLIGKGSDQFFTWPLDGPTTKKKIEPTPSSRTIEQRPCSDCGKNVDESRIDEHRQKWCVANRTVKKASPTRNPRK